MLGLDNISVVVWHVDDNGATESAGFAFSRRILDKPARVLQFTRRPAVSVDLSPDVWNEIQRQLASGSYASH